MNAKLYTYNNKFSVHNYIASYVSPTITYAQKVDTQFCFNLQ